MNLVIPSRGRRTVIACGRDPYFPAWPDVLQLNAFSAELRHAALETVLDIAGQCDGIRCDMAMLMMNDVFKWTWGTRAGDQPENDYWSLLIAKVRETPSCVPVRGGSILGS